MSRPLKELEEIKQKYKPHQNSKAWANGYHPIIVDGDPEEYLRTLGACDTKELTEMMNKYVK